MPLRTTLAKAQGVREAAPSSALQLSSPSGAGGIAPPLTVCTMGTAAYSAGVSSLQHISADPEKVLGMSRWGTAHFTSPHSRGPLRRAKKEHKT